jgi:hypothetical protein
MKISTSPRTNVDAEAAKWMREVAAQVNALSEGSITALYQSAQSVPTVGTFKQGDFVRNNAPAELGVALSKYVVFGWICTSGGTPGTWLQCRFLTGN